MFVDITNCKNRNSEFTEIILNGNSTCKVDILASGFFLSGLLKNAKNLKIFKNL